MRWHRRVLSYLVICIFVLLPHGSSLFAARSITLIGDKTSLFGDETTTLTASLSGFTDGETIYVKGAFFEEGSTNYFGYTKKDGEWIKNGDSTVSQRAVTIGKWDQTVIVKSDFLDSGFHGEGEYKLKLGFYYLTSGGNLSSVTWSANSLSYLLNEPDPTPTPSSTPTPSHTPTHTPTPRPTSSPTLPPTPTLTPCPTGEVKEEVIDDSFWETPKKDLPAEVLGAVVSSQSGIMTPQVSLRTFIITCAFLGGGCGLLSLAFTLQKHI